MKQTKFSLLAAVAALCLTALLTVQCTQTDSQHFRIKGHLTDAKDSLTISITDLEKAVYRHATLRLPSATGLSM